MFSSSDRLEGGIQYVLVFALYMRLELFKDFLILGRSAKVAKPDKYDFEVQLHAIANGRSAIQPSGLHYAMTMSRWPCTVSMCSDSY